MLASVEHGLGDLRRGEAEGTGQLQQIHIRAGMGCAHLVPPQPQPLAHRGALEGDDEDPRASEGSTARQGILADDNGVDPGAAQAVEKGLEHRPGLLVAAEQGVGPGGAGQCPSKDALARHEDGVGGCRGRHKAFCVDPQRDSAERVSGSLGERAPSRSFGAPDVHQKGRTVPFRSTLQAAAKPLDDRAIDHDLMVVRSAVRQ